MQVKHICLMGLHLFPVFEIPIFTCEDYCDLCELQDDSDEDWFPRDPYEAFKEMRNRGLFDISDMYTIADVWGWTWEKDLKNKTPERWSQEWEVDLAIKIMTKVCQTSDFSLLFNYFLPISSQRQY